MTDKQTEALRMANALDDAWAPSRYGMARNEQAAAMLRTQHAAIERKDALLRQALGALDLYKAYGWPDRNGVIPAIKQELSQ